MHISVWGFPQVLMNSVFVFWRCRLLLVCLKPHWAYAVVLHLFSFQPVEPRRDGKQAVHLLWLHFSCFSSLCLYKCYTFLIFFCLRFLITSLLSLFSTSYYTTLSKTAELNTDTSFAFIKTEIALWEIHIMIMTGLRLYLQRFLCPPLRYTINLSHNSHFRIQFPLSTIAWCYCFAFCVCLLLSPFACTGKHVILRVLLSKWNEVKKSMYWEKEFSITDSVEKFLCGQKKPRCTSAGSTERLSWEEVNR